jgi:hypothetical protein
LHYPTPKKIYKFKGATKQKIFVHAVSMIFAFENRSYLGEFEAVFKEALARESGAQEVLFDEKNRRSKISCHCPFNATSSKKIMTITTKFYLGPVIFLKNNFSAKNF